MKSKLIATICPICKYSSIELIRTVKSGKEGIMFAENIEEKSEEIIEQTCDKCLQINKNKGG